MEDNRQETVKEAILNTAENSASEIAEVSARDAVESAATVADSMISAENAVPAAGNAAPTENAPSAAGFLKVVGILMIVVGAAALIVSIVAVFGIVLISASARQSAKTVEELGINSGLLYTGGGCLLLNAAAQFVTGIVGCANCAKPEKAKTCLAWGIISAALCAVGQAAVIAGGGTFNAMTSALGLVLPALFIIGAAKNKR